MTRSTTRHSVSRRASRAAAADAIRGRRAFVAGVLMAVAVAAIGGGLGLTAGCTGTASNEPAPGTGGSGASASGGTTGAPGGSGAGSGGTTIGGSSGGSLGTTGSGGSSGTGGTTSSGGRGSGATTGGSGGTAGISGSGGMGRGGSSSTGGGAGTQPYKGLASFNGCTDVSVLNLSWYYNWTASTNCTSGAQFIPQFWGHAGENYAGELTTAVSRGYTTVLGFNEPDNATQSNIPVASAITFWPQLTSNPGIRVGSPATQANTTGQAWFTSFMSQVNADTTGRLRVDFLAIHWYGWNAGSCEPTAITLENYIKWAEAIPGNRPIWITEWACLNLSAPTAATVAAFYAGAVTMFARHPRIERYGWFTSRTADNNGLVTTAGVLTPLGTEYATAPAVR